MYRLIGYSIGQGTFTPPDGGAEVPYNNRMLKCITDNTADDVFGCDFCEFKFKAKELAVILGVKETDAEINIMLDSLLDREFEPVYAIIKGKPALNGLKFIPIDEEKGVKNNGNK